MIKDMGNVELFELCETIPEVQCKECLLYWNQGIVYCTRGHLLRESIQSKYPPMDIGSSPNPELCHYETAPSWPSFMGRLKNKRSTSSPIIWERDASRKVLKEFTIVFSTIQYFVNLYSAFDRTEEVCIQMDEVAQKAFTYRMTEDEYFRYKKNLWISLSKSGEIGPMRDRSDFNDALTKLHRLHQESGEEQLAPILFWQYQQWHPSSSSSSTSWWQWNDSWWSSWQLTKKSATELMWRAAW